MSLQSQFSTDPELEKKGVWFEYAEGDEENPPSLLLARAGGANDAFNKAMETAAQPIRRKLQNNLVSGKQLRKLNVQVYAEAVVLDWKNVELDKEVLPFSKENVVKLFTRLPEFFDTVMEDASRMAAYRKDLLEVDSGN